MTSRIDHHIFSSRALEGNLLGDPPDRDVYVYLPPSYTDSRRRRYPVAYLLHAFGQRASDLIAPTEDDMYWKPPLQDVLDPVFGRMGTPEMIVAIPDGWTRYGCSQWVDSPVNGCFEQMVCEEVVPFLDGSYRTIAGAGGRGILGFSSGGLGAWHIGSRRPDLFAAMAVLSGDSYFDLTHSSIVYRYLAAIYPGAPNGPVEDSYASGMAYALAASYSPNVHDPPFYVDLPVDHVTGELIPAIWNRWLAYDPVVNYVERLDNLRRLRGILLDAGRNDDADLQWGHRVLSHRMTEAGIEHSVHEHAGNHSGRSRERHQVALAWMGRLLG